MIDEAHMDAQKRAEWREGLDRGLRAAQNQIEHLQREAKDPNMLAGLETVNRDIVAILQDVAEITPDSDQERLSS
jgi:hypothetical protein